MTRLFTSLFLVGMMAFQAQPATVRMASEPWVTNRIAVATNATLAAAKAYTDQEVSVSGISAETGTNISSAVVGTHNASGSAHADIRSSVSNKLELADTTNGVIMVVGDGARASVPQSGAFGYYASATGAYSSASGIFSDASGPYSTAHGLYATASGDRSSAFGLHSLARGQYSTAVGYLSDSFGTSSASIGYDCSSEGYASAAFGIGCYSLAYASSAFGVGASAAASNSVAIGAFSVVEEVAVEAVNIGEGIAYTPRWLHYRGHPIADADGLLYDPAGVEYTRQSMLTNKLSVTWNAEFSTYDVSLGLGVVGQLFQENHVFVRNRSGVTLEDGRAVKISGSQGDQVLASYASSDDSASKWTTIGLVTSPGGITNNGFGFATTFGNVNDINTIGLTVSNAVWLSTNGTLTITEPNIAAVAAKIKIGMSLREHANDGRLFVSVLTVPNWTDVGAVTAETVTNIVTDAQSLVSTLYGYGSRDSDLSGYKVLSNGFVNATSYNTITNAASTNNQYVASFAEDISRFTRFQGGHDVVGTVYITKGATGVANVSQELYFLTTNGTVLAEYASPSRAIGTEPAVPFSLRTTIPTNLVFSVPVRRAVRYKVSGIGTPAPTIYVHSEDARPLVVEFPVTSGDFATSEELAALDTRVDNIVAPVPVTLASTNLTFVPYADRTILCSNAAYIATFETSTYQTGRINWASAAIDWRTNGLTTLTWPTNIVWQASTNAPSFTHGKRYFLFGQNYGDSINGTWWMSTSGAF